MGLHIEERINKKGSELRYMNANKLKKEALILIAVLRNERSFSPLRVINNPI